MNNTTGELTLSFRSTEFIDDAVRDSKASNRFEVKDLGWALGQIADMEEWYAELRENASLLGGPNFTVKKFNVTGYSLGGHLATAFNILRREESLATGAENPIIATYTFNGAGVGDLKSGVRLPDVIANFSRLRASPDITAAGDWLALSAAQRSQISNLAQRRVNDIEAERIRVNALSGVVFALDATGVPLGDQSSLTYQIAALVAARDTVATSLFVGPDVNTIPTTPKFAEQFGRQSFPSMTEIVGSDSGNLGPSWVSNSGIHYGARQEVYIEDQPLLRGNYDLVVDQGAVVSNPAENDFADTHSLVHIVDSLSLMAVLELVDPSITFETARRIYAAASSAKSVTIPGAQGTAEGDTLERMLDALRALVIGPNQTRTGDYQAMLSGNTWHLEALRIPFHTNLAALEVAIGSLRSASDTQFSIHLLPSDFAEIVSRASGSDATAVAYRYALKNLNPFVVVADGVQPAVYEDSAYAKYHPEGAPDGLTTQYLNDRAAFVSWKVLKNTANLQGAITKPVLIPHDFVDNGSDYKVELRSTVAGGATSIDASKVIFGSDLAEAGAQSIRGGSRDDHLYGAGGDDNLFGDGGRDYLEGNAGNDKLDGGDGSDVLIGGTGDDDLTGAKGNDWLYGGAGHDIYRYAAGDGDDAIYDSDGSGQIVYTVGNTGYVLTGGKNVGDNLWQRAGTPVLYGLFHGSDGSTTLNILGPGGRLFIQGFDVAADPLGIDLQDADPDVLPPVAVGRDIVGDLQPAEPTEYDNLRNLIVTSNPSPDRADTLNGSIGNDRILSAGGDDVIDAFAGDDRIDSGTGRDRVTGGEGNDVIEGGAGTDIIIGGGGNDRIYAVAYVSTADFINGDLQPGQAGTPGDHDWLAGGAGDDVIVGSAGDDGLSGGGGDDLIIGGDGADNILSDADYLAHSFEWTYTDTAPDSANRFAARVFQATGVGDPGDSGADTIYAGAGDDWIRAGFGDDTIFGEGDNDSIAGEGGSDTILGGEGADHLSGDAPYIEGALHGADYIDGGAGADTLTGEGGGDTLYGGDGDDSLVGDIGIEYLAAEFHGDDYLDGGAGNDTLLGFGGADTLYGAGGDDELFGDGNETPEANHGEDFLDGGVGHDFMVGSGGADTLLGGDGDDRLYGDANDMSAVNHGADYLDGGSGNDILVGSGSADRLVGGAGDDRLSGDSSDTPAAHHGADLLDGGEGDDILTGEGGADTVYGGAGDDRLFGDADDTPVASHGGDYIDGGNGNDILRGYGGNDTLSGGPGNDVLSGDGGKDTYTFNLGDGVDRIQDESKGPDASVILFGSGVTPDMLKLGLGSLLINVGTGGDAIHIDSFDIRDPYAEAGFERFDFADGTSLDWSGLLGLGFDLVGTAGDDALWGANGPDTIDGLSGHDFIHVRDGDDIVNGGAGDDIIYAQGGADTLSGGSGNDTLYGGRGQDTYQVGPDPPGSESNGHDLIIDYDPTEGISDTLVLDYDPSALRVLRDHTDTILCEASNGAPLVTLGNQVHAHYRIEQVQFADGTAWDVAQLFAQSHAAATTQRVIGSAGDDTLTSHANSSDELQGGAGADTYIFNGLFGQDVIFDFDDGEAALDRIQFGAGILESHTAVARDGFNLYLTTISGRVTIANWFTSSEFRIEQVEFSSGTTWTASDLIARSTQIATGGASYYGTDGEDVLAGGAGDDKIYGLEGNDTINLGNNSAGFDVSDGGIGNDTYLQGQFSRGVINDSDPNPGNLDTFVFESFRRLDNTSFIAVGDNIALGGAPVNFPYEPGFNFMGNTTAFVETAHAFFAFPNTVYETHTSGQIERFRFSNGAALTPSTLLDRTWDSHALGDLGSDVIQGRDARDWIAANEGDDLIHGGTRADYIYGGGGGDEIHSDGGDDTVYGGSGDDVIAGGEGDDTIEGNAGDDTISGGAGADRLAGGLDTNDTYLFNRGDGSDVITDLATDAAPNTLVFGPGITPDMVQFDILGVSIGAGERIDLVASGMDINTPYGSHAIGNVRFHDGQEFTYREFVDRGLTATAGNVVLVGAAGPDRLTGNLLANELYGGNGADTFDGGAGNDDLIGGRGSDTYLFGRGAGHDSVREVDAAGDDVDVVQIAAGVSPGQVNVFHDGNSLRLEIEGTPDRITVENGYRDARVERVLFADGTHWDILSLRAIAISTIAQTADQVIDGTAGADSLTGGGGGDRIDGVEGSDALFGFAGDDLLMGGGDNDYLSGGTGDDTLDGGSGNDSLRGGQGSDTYRYGRGYGFDTIVDDQSDGLDVDTVRLVAGLASADVSLIFDFANFYLSINDTAERLTILNMASGVGLPQRLEFDDGVVWDQATMLGHATYVEPISNAIDGSDENDDIVGSDDAETIAATLGDDRIDAQGGDDHLLGGYGNDLLEGGDGNDVLEGGEGDDTLVGGSGNDRYFYPAGEWSGTDYIFAPDATVGKVDALFFEGDRPGSVTLSRWFADLRVTHSGGMVVVGEFYASPSNRIEEIQFGDGSIWDLEVLLNFDHILVATASDGDDVVDAPATALDPLVGGVGDDVLFDSSGVGFVHGGLGNDTLRAGGQTTLYGGVGDDTYVFGLGSYRPKIVNIDPDHSTIDKLQFGEGVAPNDVTLWRNFPQVEGVSSHLSVTIERTGDLLTIENWFRDDIYKLDHFRFNDGTTWDRLAIEQRLAVPEASFDHDLITGSGLDDVISGGTGRDAIRGYLGDDTLGGGDYDDRLFGEDGDDRLDGGADNDQLSGDAGDDCLDGGPGEDALFAGEGGDTLAGGPGNDFLQGGLGDDTYVFNAGDGRVDAIVETGAVDGVRFGVNRLRLGTGITPDSLTLKAGSDEEFRLVHDVYFGGPIEASDLVIGYHNAEGNPNRGDFPQLSNFTADIDRILIKDGLDERIQFIDFADGTTWTHAQVMEHLARSQLGGLGDDVIGGRFGSDVIHGREGNDAINGYQSGDDLYGDDGNDTLDGGAGVDYLLGGSGDDLLRGGMHGDYLSGGDGNDVISGDEGNDTISGGAGNDNIAGHDGTDTIEGGDGNDHVEGGAGDDVLEGGDGDDTVVGGSGNDRLLGEIGADELFGHDGDDVLFGHAGADRLFGGDGNDSLFGDVGNALGSSDFLDGGRGADILDGGAGSDIYVIDHPGDRVTERADTFVQGVGTVIGGIDLVQSSITHTLSANVENLTLTGPDVIAGTGNNLNNLIIGNAAGNVLTGLAGNDRIDGGAGADTMAGGSGNDTYVVQESGDGVSEELNAGTDSVEASISYTLGAHLENLTLTGDARIDATGNSLDNVFRGNGANNTFIGGDGSDTYHFGRGAGEDIVYDTATVAGRTDVVQVGAGVLSGDVNVFRNGADLQLAIRFTQDRLSAQDWFTGTPYQIEQVRFDNGTVWNIAMLESMAGPAPVNHAPSLAAALADQASRDGVAYSYTVAAGTFFDSDVGDSLLLTATLAAGAALPDWLEFDAASRTFSSAQPAQPGTFSIKLTATDVGGLSASDVFDLTVGDVNSAPTLVTTVANQSATQGAAFTFVVPADTYADPDAGDTLTYAATRIDGIALPSWLTFEPITRTFHGTPLNTDVGTVSVKLIASDRDNLSVTNEFELTVININDAPTLDHATLDQVATAGTFFVLTLPAAAFSDIDAGDTLSYEADSIDGSGLPRWLTFDAASQRFSGTPMSDDVGTYRIKVTAADGANTSAADVFDISVVARPGNITVTGTANNDVLAGGAGNDTLDGRRGADTMTGFSGNDAYWVDHAGDVVLEAAGGGIDWVMSALSYGLGPEVEHLWLQGAAAINGDGNALANTLTGNAGSNQLVGFGGDDALNGQAGADTMVGGTGNDYYRVDNALDLVVEEPDHGIDVVVSSVIYSLTPNVEALTLTGVSALDGTGNAQDNFLSGNGGANALDGGGGNDVLDGGAGNDGLVDTSGNNLFLGGIGDDALAGGAGNDILIGGAGNDAIAGGAGANVIAFNRGDGQDRVRAHADANNTLSLGGGIRYEDLAFIKDGEALVLETGGGDRLAIADWYAEGSSARGVSNLQIIAEAMSDFTPGGDDPLRDNKLERFDFGKLVQQFDEARAAVPGLDRWAVMNALLEAHLSGSDTEAVGGDLAYRYGLSGALTGLGFNAAKTLLGNAQLSSAQALQPLAELREGVVKLG